jgi:hypothetical protein
MNFDMIFLVVVTLLTLAVFGIDVSQKRRQ